jgi:hypothetical protein
MTPLFLLPECVVQEDGQGAEVALATAHQGKRLLLTLSVTRILERETLEVSIHSSRDRTTWLPLAAFPQKSYCGTYSLPVDLTSNPDVRHLRVHWKMSRWNHPNPKPVFGFHVFAEELRTKVAGAA